MKQELTLKQGIIMVVLVIAGTGALFGTIMAVVAHGSSNRPMGVYEIPASPITTIEPAPANIKEWIAQGDCDVVEIDGRMLADCRPERWE